MLRRHHGCTVLKLSFFGCAHDFIVHLADQFTLLARHLHTILLQRSFLLAPDLSDIRLPGLHLQNAYQVLTFVCKLPILTSPAQFVQVALQMGLDSFEAFGLFAKLHKY